MNIAIIGAGAVALSSAALAVKNGHRVSLWSALPHEVAALRALGHVTCEGELAGTFPIAVVAEAGQAIAAADIVMIAAPAFAHRALMTACVPHVRPEQLLVMNTATGFGSMLWSRLLAGRNVAPTIVDLATTICTARVSGAGRVRVGPLKPGVSVATIPAARGAAGRAALTEAFGDFFVLRESALAIALNNHNPVYHVPALLFSLPTVERAEPWNLWRNLTPMIARYAGKLDDERMTVASRFGVEAIPLATYLRTSMDLQGDDLVALFAAAAIKRPLPSGPTSVEDRYMTEDMPYGMVFFRALGQAADVPMPVSEHLIDLCSDLYGRDFRTEAPGLAELGLAGQSPAEISRLARDGFHPAAALRQSVP